MRELILPDVAATEALGAALARAVTPPLVIYLQGELGAGKTTLVRALVHALGYAGRVKSPTYTLHETYELPAYTVHHLDLYRLADPREAAYLGLDDLLHEPTLVLIEWPARGADFVPPADLVFWIEHEEAGRRARVVAHSPPGATVAATLMAGEE